VTDDKKVQMAAKLVQVGYDPTQVLKALDLPAIDHTGLPSIQLQPVANVGDTDDIYDVARNLEKDK
jgi:hypothetical protein